MVWKLLTDFFDFLPLAAVIDNEIMCVHGGLSPKIKKIEDINSIERFQEILLEVNLIKRQISNCRQPCS